MNLNLSFFERLLCKLTMGSIRIGIAEDFQPIRDAVITKLTEVNDLSVVVAASNGKELLVMLEGKEVDIVLMDIRMPIMDGLQTTTILRDRFPCIKVIAFTQNDCYNNIIQMSRLGVKSFLLKEDINLLIRVIKIINDGGIYFTDEIGAIIQSSIGYDSGLNTSEIVKELSAVQLQVLKAICSGLSSTEIGEIVNKSSRTVEDYRSTLYKIFHVNNKEQLISSAIAQKIVKPITYTL